MPLAAEFRARALRCLKLAHGAPTLEAQTHWIAMADLWLSLAQHAEEQDALFLAHPADTAENREGGERSDGESHGQD
jgi:hypothetical protein